MAILSPVCMWSRIVTFVLERNGLSFLLLSFAVFFFTLLFSHHFRVQFHVKNQVGRKETFLQEFALFCGATVGVD